MAGPAAARKRPAANGAVADAGRANGTGHGRRRDARTVGAGAADRRPGPKARPDAADELGLPLAIGSPPTAPWREHALTRITELQFLANWLRAAEQDTASDRFWEAIHSHLQEARETAAHRGRTAPLSRLRSWSNGAAIERTESNIDAAEADLLRLAPLSFVQGQLPSIVAEARQHLSPGDPRRIRLEQLARESGKRNLKPDERGPIVAAARAAKSAGRREVMRVRSFRNVLLIAAALLAVAAIGLAALGVRSPDALPLCFTPGDKVVCPTSESALQAAADVDEVVRATSSPWDIPLVAMVGLIAAAVAAAAALRRIRGTSTPYSLPVALAVLKLPTGALTAVLGLLLMRGQFIPGLSALDFPAQIMAWAVVFGYAQELFTRLVDRQAQAVLDDVGGPTGAPAPTI